MESKDGDTGFEAALPSHSEVLGLLRLCIAADTYPRGGLYTGFYCLSAALRYELIWLKILREHGVFSQPPLDVALAWLVHRQYPVSYANSLRRRCSMSLTHPAGDLAFAFCAAASSQWRAVAGDIPTWPPPPPGSEHDLAAATVTANWQPALATQLCESMSRFSWQLRSWLRPHFLDVGFLERARSRYARFLALHAAHPDAILVPTADIALLWHTHLGLGSSYLEACDRLGRGQRQQQQPLGEQQQEQQPAVAVTMATAMARQQQTPRPEQDLQDQAAQQELGAKSSQLQQQQKPGKQTKTHIDIRARSETDTSRAQQQARSGQQRHEDLQLTGPPGCRGEEKGPQSGVQKGRGQGQEEPATPQPPQQQAPSSAWSGSCQPFRPNYLDLPLEGPQLREAYRRTARLYEVTYGEPYDGPDTAWLSPSAQHPLAAPWSPLSYVLRAFEDTPQQAEVLQATLRAASRIITTPRGPAGYAPGGGGCGGGPPDVLKPASTVRRLTPTRHLKLLSYASSASLGGFLPSTGSVSGAVGGVNGPSAPCRAGGHALFAAWLASQRASSFFQSKTCGGLCFRRSWSIRVATVERVIPPLVNIAFLRDLPDSSSHPFLTAVRLRSGLWQEVSGGGSGSGKGEGEEERGAAEDGEGAAGAEEEPSVNAEEEPSVNASLSEEAEPSARPPSPAPEPATIALAPDTEPRSEVGSCDSVAIASPGCSPNLMGGREVMVTAAVRFVVDAETAIRRGEGAADEGESVTMGAAGAGGGGGGGEGAGGGGAGGGGGGGGAGAEGASGQGQEQQVSTDARQSPPLDGKGQLQLSTVAITGILPAAGASAAPGAASGGAAPGAASSALSVPAAAPGPAPAAVLATASCSSLPVQAADNKPLANPINPSSFRSTTTFARVTGSGAIPTCAGGRGLSGDGRGPVVHLYGGRPLTPADAEVFLDDAAMRGLAVLLEASAAAVTIKVEASHGDPADSACDSASGSASPTTQVDVPPPRSAVHLGPDGSPRSRSGGGGGGKGEVGGGGGGGRCGRQGDAPLWGILGDPVYAKRARAYFQHVWSETGRRGLEQAQMQAQGPGPGQEQEPTGRQWRGRV